MIQYLRSLIFTLFLFATALIWAFLITLAMPFSRAFRFALVRSWARLIMAGTRTICGLDYKVEGRENIPTQPAVFYLKHSSTWETIAQIAEFGPQTWVLKRELLWIPIIGTGMVSLWCIAINRKGGKSAVDQVIEQGLERLRGDFNVMIFPEGTRMAPGQTRRYGRSGALLAVRAGCPLVPIAQNAGDYWSRRSLMKHRGTIRFCVGPPIDTRGRSDAEANAQAKDWIDRKMAEISPAHTYPVPTPCESGDPVTVETG